MILYRGNKLENLNKRVDLLPFSCEGACEEVSEPSPPSDVVSPSLDPSENEQIPTLLMFLARKLQLNENDQFF